MHYHVVELVDVDKLDIEELALVEHSFTESDLLCKIEVDDLVDEGRAGGDFAEEGIFACGGTGLLAELTLGGY